MREVYAVEMDDRGHILIPAAVRKAKGYGKRTLFALIEEGDELRLVPGEIVPKRETRMYTNEEIAQSLIDGAVSPEGVRAAREAICRLGLDPDEFKPNL
jgi:bifunctional DNA-binding transcriptional regulator/antitoxin component of YhaV-PrlF toxin-antitoxin module